MLRRHCREMPPCAGGRILRLRFCSARHHELSALVTIFWTQIDTPAVTMNQIEEPTL